MRNRFKGWKLKLADEKSERLLVSVLFCLYTHSKDNIARSHSAARLDERVECRVT